MYHASCTRTATSGAVTHRQVSYLSLYAIAILFDSSAPASLSQPPPASTLDSYCHSRPSRNAAESSSAQ